MADVMSDTYPRIAAQLHKTCLADLPTPVQERSVSVAGGRRIVLVKRDDLTSGQYGGNKVRKLEYLMRRARDRGAQRVATFGAAGSNHALATAVHAAELGLACTCFLSHQQATPNIARTLNMHRRLGTEIVRWGGGVDRLALYRKYLQHRSTWVIPLGGTCWLGSVGFVNAGLELAAQVRCGDLPAPRRIYIACGTTGSAAGLVLGLTAAGLDTTVHAIKVADNPFASPAKLGKLIGKTRILLNRLDPSFTADGWEHKLVWREEFLAGGYAKIDDATAAAVRIARDELGLSLETTYTGKAMAALLHDLQSADHDGEPVLFWNTYNSAPLPVDDSRPTSLDNIPPEFARYYG